MITVAQLPDSPPLNVFLRCAACANEVSADKRDYFAAEPDTEMVCECGFELFIVSRRTIYDHDKGQQWLNV